MGTTKTAIENGDNPVLAYVIAIEGHLTVYSTWGQDTAAVVTAWSGTGFTAAAGGLETPGEIAQSIDPFRPSIESNTTTFVVNSGPDDVLASVFATDKSDGNFAKLTTSVDADDSSFTVGSSADMASSGAAYVGNERFTYTTKSSATLLDGTVVRGVPAPFAINGGTTWGRAHRVSTVAGGAVSYPFITDFPRRWIGKWVGCWAHRVVDGVLDVKSEAQRIFAGKIADIRDGMSQGEDVTVFDCTDTREAVKSAVLMSDQFTCLPKSGVALSASDSIRLRWWASDFAATPTYEHDDAELIVGTGGYIAVGHSSATTVLVGLADFISDSGLTATWHVRRIDGITSIEAESAGSMRVSQMHVSMSPSIAGLLGYDIESPDGTDDEIVWYPTGLMYSDIDNNETAGTRACKVMASFPNAFALGVPVSYAYSSQAQSMEVPTGTWIDQASDLPEPFDSMSITSSGSWGFLLFRDFVMLAKYVSDTSFQLYYSNDANKMFGIESQPGDLTDIQGLPLRNSAFVRVGESLPRYRQAILIRNDLDYIVPRLLASTGASTYNHATYDAWDYQLSADGGIPWDLLGDEFIASIEHLASFADTSTMTMILEKPTKLEAILLPEMSLRNAHLVLKDGALIFASPSQPSAGAAEHSINTSHKAADPDSVASDWPEYTVSRNTIVSHIKVEFNRNPKGEYRDVIEVSNEQTKTDHGTSEPLTIKARNSIDIGDGAGETVRDLVYGLAADALAYYNKPLPVASRSLAIPKWFIVPGLDRVNVTDSFIRGSNDGARGISAAPAWVTGIVQNWKTGIGTIRVTLLDEGSSRRTIYSPCGFIDDAQATSGYDHANSRIHLVANEFSLAAEDNDITHWDAGDLGTIIERSPATPGSPTKFDFTIDTVNEGGDAFDMTAQLPAANSLDGGETWFVVSQERSAAQATQQADCYTGDDADGKIEGLVRNREWVSQAPELGVTTAAVQTNRHEYPPTDGDWWTEGQPVHPGMHRGMINSVNSLIGYKTAVQMPQMLDSSTRIQTTETSYVLCTFPMQFYIGRGRFTSLKRVINVGTMMLQTTAGTGSIRITSSAFMPQSTSAVGTTMVVSFLGPNNQTEFTNTSTTLRAQTATTLEIVPSPGGEYTWLTVEMKTSANTNSYWGLHTLNIGPLAA